jgi:hypothetical protein
MWHSFILFYFLYSVGIITSAYPFTLFALLFIHSLSFVLLLPFFSVKKNSFFLILCGRLSLGKVLLFEMKFLVESKYIITSCNRKLYVLRQNFMFFSFDRYDYHSQESEQGTEWIIGEKYDDGDFSLFFSINTVKLLYASISTRIVEYYIK